MSNNLTVLRYRGEEPADRNVTRSSAQRKEPGQFCSESVSDGTEAEGG